jgi:hypothetical protein
MNDWGDWADVGRADASMSVRFKLPITTSFI